MTGRHPRESLLDVLTKPLAASGLDVEDVLVSSVGRRRVVRVLIDKDGGVSLDDITAATTRVSDLLDDRDVLGDAPYTLEVTSPGVDRPLTQPRHWRRNMHRLVKVTPYDSEPLTGRVMACDEIGVTLQLDRSLIHLAFSDVAKARVEIEFNPPVVGDGPPSPADGETGVEPVGVRVDGSRDVEVELDDVDVE